MLKQLHDINCVFEGFDGIGAIYISGITGAKNLSVLQSIYTYHLRVQHQSRCLRSSKWISSI